MINVKKTGDWKKAESITSSMVNKYHLAADMATMREAQFLRKKMVEGIRSGAPGGKTFLPLAASTLAVRKRGGTKPLIATGGLRNSITVKKQGDMVFVGILRSAKGGKINVAENNEFGKTFVMPLTPKARRFLMAKFRNAGILNSEGGDSGGTGVIVIKIPARPFVGPVVEAHAQPKDVRKRFEENLAFAMGYILGKP